MTDREAIERIEWIVDYNLLTKKDLEAMELGISALKEREQRSKGCDFCNEELYDYPYICAHGEYSESDTVYKPGFCPMCGRPLNDLNGGKENAEAD